MANKVFELEFPFEHRGTNYTKFEMRRPRVRDLREFLKNLDKDPTSAMEKVIANLCEIDGTIIEMIDIQDYAPMKGYFEDFLKPMLGDSEAS